jgi:hypothetical protein
MPACGYVFYARSEAFQVDTIAAYFSLSLSHNHRDEQVFRAVPTRAGRDSLLPGSSLINSVFIWRPKAGKSYIRYRPASLHVYIKPIYRSCFPPCKVTNRRPDAMTQKRRGYPGGELLCQRRRVRRCIQLNASHYVKSHATAEISLTHFSGNEWRAVVFYTPKKWAPEDRVHIICSHSTTQGDKESKKNPRSGSDEFAYTYGVGRHVCRADMEHP